jgi:tRNA(Ile)-lysidine synthase
LENEPKKFVEVYSLLDKVKKTIEKYQLLTKGERVVVGFSGGIDSLCLLHILAGLTEFRLDIWALYINHSLRPAENILEEQLLYEVGERFKVNTRQIKIDIPERIHQKPQSLQLLAREERYRIFEAFRQEVGASKVALAHHRDDQAETVLYRLIRGTGLDGLAGMPVIRDGIYIRPLLLISRAEIQAYAALHQLLWVEDSSNHKLIYRRNRLRNQLIPEIEAHFNPRFREALVRLSELAAEQRDFMEALAGEQLPGVLVTEPHRIGLKLRPFLKFHPYLQYYLLTKVLSGLETAYRMESLKLKRLLAKIINETVLFQPVNIYKRVSVYYENEVIFFEKDLLRGGMEPGALKMAVYPANIPGETRVTELNLMLTTELTMTPQSWGNVNAWESYLNPDEFQLPAEIRFWRPGDAFRPLGAGGTQKLHDFFINLKIPRYQRSKIPLLVDAQGRIAWVVGYRLSDEFKVRKGQAAVWHITAREGNNV